jgi:hypothetical protein
MEASEPEGLDDERDARRDAGQNRGLLNSWMRELDFVIDDFLNKRLGNGDIYYGKRKSGFHGEAPGMDGRKAEPAVRDRSEDYRGGGWSDIRRMARRLPDFRPPSGQGVEEGGVGGKLPNRDGDGL